MIALPSSTFYIQRSRLNLLGPELSTLKLFEMNVYINNINAICMIPSR